MRFVRHQNGWAWVAAALLLAVLLPGVRATAPATATDTDEWAARFSSPAAADYPQPEWVVDGTITPAQAGASLDAFRSAGYETVVVVAGRTGPFFDPGAPSAALNPVAGTLMSMLGVVLDAAAARGMHIWLEAFGDHKLDVENGVKRAHPEFEGYQLAEKSRGQDYEVQRGDYDRLNPAATDAYIDALLGTIERTFPARLGTTLVGLWDDESDISSSTDSAGGSTRPWSAVLPAAFAAAKGYAIDTAQAEEALFHGDDAWSRRVRYDYWDVVSRLFENHFGRMRDWLAARGMDLVVQPLKDMGRAAEDMWAEGSFFRQVGGASIPGADTLWNDDDQGGVSRTDWGVTAKQVSSAARLAGRPARSGVVEAEHEPFGWSQPGLARMRSYTDRLFARGTTLLHPAFYVDRHDPAAGAVNGAALAPDLFTANVQWPDQRAWAQYAARLRTLLAGGAPVSDVLVLSPQPTAWAWNPEQAGSHGNNGEGGSMTYLNVATALTDAHRGFELAPQDVLTDPATTVAGGRVQRAGMSFPVVVLPEVQTLTDAEADALEAFAAGGGRVVAVTRVPDLSASGDDAHVRQAMARLFGPGGGGVFVDTDLGGTTDVGAATAEAYAPFLQAIDTAAPPDVIVRNEGQTTTRGHTANEVLHVRQPGGDVVFVTNYPTPTGAVTNEQPLGAEDSNGDWSRAARRVVVSVHATGVPELWDPATGTTSQAKAWWPGPSGRIEVEVPLPAQGAMAVVFRNDTAATVEPHVLAPGTGVTDVWVTAAGVQVTADWPAAPHQEWVPVDTGSAGLGIVSVPLATTARLAPLPQAGPWQFTLTNSLGAVVAEEVRDAGSWAAAHPGVSGTGVYQSLAPGLGTLDVPASHLAPGTRLWLDLGGARDVAEAWVNGMLVGRTPWPPYRFDVTSAVHPGANTVRLAITNTSANGAVGLGADPVRASGLIDPPVLEPRVTVVGVAAPGSSTTGPPPATANLLADPSFEMPTAWLPDGGGAFSFTSSPVRSGTTAASIAAPVRPVAWWRPATPVPVREAGRYDMAAWFWGDGAAPTAGGRLGVRWLDARGRVLAAELGPGRPPDGGWARLSWSVVAPDGAVAALPLYGMDVEFATAGRVAIDDAEFTGAPQ